MKVTCPVCTYRTLPEKGQYDICPVCFWEDDGNRDPQGDPGPNAPVTLAQARVNYRRMGAIEDRFLHCVRAPSEAEIAGREYPKCPQESKP